MRILNGCKPFIKDRVDQFSEMSQWQTFFVMFTALLIKFVSPEMKKSKGERARQLCIFFNNPYSHTPLRFQPSTWSW